MRGPHQLVCLATGDEDLLRWTKDPTNPVVPDFPPGLNLLTTDEGKVHYRDPSVWREDGFWRMIVGSGLTGVGGTVLLYRSSDLRNWEYERPLLVGDQTRREPVWTGTMWECPQLFPLDGKHVLLISVWHERRTLYPAYITGTYTDGEFTPEHMGVLDPGSHYAPQTLLDENGRRILIGWLREQRPPEAAAAQGWSGAMTIPWILGLGKDGSLRYTPAPELATLRQQHSRFSDLSLTSHDPEPLADAVGDSLELQATIEPGTAGKVGLIVRRSPDGAEQTRVVYDADQGSLFIARDRSSLDPQGDTTPHQAQLQLAEGEALELRVFLDRSVIEVVANRRALLSERIYPSRDDSLGLAGFAEGGAGRMDSLDVWHLASSIA